MAIKQHIPNTITLLNLVSGSAAVYFAFQGDASTAFYLILLSLLFDFGDGFAARSLKAYSAMGKELDSLADVISFGLAPGALAFSMLQESSYPDWVKFFAFIIPAFSALRLAKFNIDENQTTSFIGMATPANAIFWGGLSYSYNDFFVANPWLILLLIVIFSGLLVAKIPMFAFKFSDVKWVSNKTQYIFLAGSTALLVFFGWGGFMPVIIWYILASLLLYPRLKK